MTDTVVCPVCGRELKRVNDNTPRSGGVMHCPGCKSAVRYWIENGRAKACRA